MTRIKSGPRTVYGYLDRALEDLAKVAAVCGCEDEEVKKRREAIVQRVRRIVRAEVKAEREAFSRHLRQAGPPKSGTWGGSGGVI